MSVIALLGLAVLWAIVLVPDLLRRGASLRRIDPIGQFAKNRSVLGHTTAVGGSAFGRSRSHLSSPSMIDLRGPRPVVDHRPVSAARVAPRPVRRSRAEQRRQDVLTALIAAALLSFLGFTAFGGPMLVVHVIADVLLVAYVGLWLNVTKRERQRAQVSHLYPSMPLNGLSVASSRHRVAR